METKQPLKIYIQQGMVWKLLATVNFGTDGTIINITFDSAFSKMPPSVQKMYNAAFKNINVGATASVDDTFKGKQLHFTFAGKTTVASGDIYICIQYSDQTKVTKMFPIGVTTGDSFSTKPTDSEQINGAIGGVKRNIDKLSVNDSVKTAINTDKFVNGV